MKLIVVLLGLCCTISGLAQNFTIALQGNGSLSWSGDATNFTSYSVQWAPSVTGPWSSSWDSLKNIPSISGTVTVAVPMFYRVVGVPIDRPGDRCDNAQPASMGTNPGSTVAYANDYDASSFGIPTPGRDRVYRVIVPAGQRLAATVTPSGQEDAALVLLSGAVACSQASSNILAAVNAGTAGIAETAYWVNSGPSPFEVLVVVDSPTVPDSGGDYQLTIAFEAPPPGETCASATPITVGSPPLTDQTTIGYANDHGAGTGCVGAAGPDRYYAISIPPGKTLVATVIPTSSWDPSVSIISSLDGCSASAACLASSDAAGVGETETVQYANLGVTVISVFIVVDSASVSGAGTFTLSAAFSP